MASFISLLSSETLNLSHQHCVVLGKNLGASLGAKWCPVIPGTEMFLQPGGRRAAQSKGLCSCSPHKGVETGAELQAELIIAELFPSLRVSLASAPAPTSEPGKTLGRALAAGSAKGGWQCHGRGQPCHCSLALCPWMGQRGLPSRAQTSGRDFPPAGAKPKAPEASINK